MATLASMREANHTRVVSVTILIEANLEEAKKIVWSVDATISSWFISIFNFLKLGDLSKDQRSQMKLRLRQVDM